MQKPKVDEKLFRCIKTLLSGGASPKEVAEYMQVSAATVSRVKRAETYEEYKNESAAIAMEIRKKEKKAEGKPQTQVVRHEQSITLVATHYMMEELKAQTEYLKLISNKLAFLIDELTGPVKSKAN